MRINNNSKLNIHNLYFSKIIFEKSVDKKDNSYSVDYNVTGVAQKNGCVEVTIDTKINGTNQEISLLVQTIGVFSVDNDVEDEIKDFILKNNSVAYMLPIIRNQVLLLTSQPNMEPILLPPVDVTELVGKH